MTKGGLESIESSSGLYLLPGSAPYRTEISRGGVARNGRFRNRTQRRTPQTRSPRAAGPAPWRDLRRIAASLAATRFDHMFAALVGRTTYPNSIPGSKKIVAPLPNDLAHW